MQNNNSGQTVNNKIPPHNIEAEQAVLASSLIDPSVIDELIGRIDGEDFYLPSHKMIFAALVSLHNAAKPLDLVTLVTRLTDEGNLEKAGGFEYVSELVQIIPNSANVQGYAKIIHEKSLLRKMVSAGGSISELGYNVVDDVDELINDAQAIVFNLGASKLKTDAEHIGVVASQNYDKLAKLYEMEERDRNVSGVISGFPDLDKVTNGFQRSDLIIVAGRPGMGKTSFGLNIVLNAAMTGHAVVFFSLEMSSEQLVNRLISSEERIKLSTLRTGNFQNDEWKKLGDFTSKLEKLDIYLDDTPQITVNQLRAKCRRLKARNKLDMIFVDYLQIMGFNRSITVREQQISEISRSLKGLAKELNIPIMAFAQVSRSVESRSDNRRPYLSDLRESGAIEQDADIIMFLYRDEVYNEDTVYKNIAEIIIAKHRNGELATVPVSFDAEYTKFGARLIEKHEYFKMTSANKPVSRRKKGDAPGD